MPANIPSEDEVLSYFDTLSNWGRWGDDDQLGTLNLLSPAKQPRSCRKAQLYPAPEPSVGRPNPTIWQRRSISCWKVAKAGQAATR